MRLYQYIPRLLLPLAEEHLDGVEFLAVRRVEQEMVIRALQYLLNVIFTMDGAVIHEEDTRLVWAVLINQFPKELLKYFSRYSTFHN